MTFVNPLKSEKIPSVEMIEQSPAFHLVMELDFTEMIPFVLTNIRRRSYLSILYVLINLGFLVLAVFVALQGLMDSQLNWSMVFRQSLGGLLAGSILIIPVHELLHGLAYLLLGAAKIRFGADMRQFIFFVTADRCPVSGKGLSFLAMTPFLVINVVTLFVFRTWFPEMALLSIVMLLCHNIMCIGDFAIVNFVLLARGKIISFDKPEKQKSYFYEEVVI